MTQHFVLETIDGITVVTFSDAKIVPETNDPLYRLVEDERHRRLLLNLSNVRFLSSNALGILVSLKKKVDAAGGRVEAVLPRTRPARTVADHVPGSHLRDVREPG